jgi:zinc protease
VLLELAALRLAGARSSLLEERLVNSGMALDVSSEVHTLRDRGVFVVRCVLHRDGSPELVESEIRALLGSLGREPVETEQMDSLRRLDAAIALESLSTPVGAAWECCSSETVFGRPSLEREMRDLAAAATPEVLMEACARWLDPGGATVVELRPAGGSSGPSDIPRPRGDIAPPERLEPDFSPSMTILRTDRRSISDGSADLTLPNGVRLVHRRDLTFPLCTVAFSIPMGSAREPREHPGLAALAAEAMMQGPPGVGSIRFHERLERLGAGAVFSAGRESASGRVDMLSGDLEPSIRFISDLLFGPGFEGEDVERLRREMVSVVRHRRETPVLVAQDRLDSMMCLDPAEAGIPTEESIGSITAEMLRDFHSACAVPSGLVLAVAGDFDPDLLAGLAEECFGSLQGGSPPPLRSPEPRTAGMRACTAMEGRTQAMILAGMHAPPRGSADCAAMILLDQVLGGGFASRLTRAIRTAEGLAYGAGCEYSAGALSGRFTAYAAVAPGSAGRALGILEGELDALIDHGIGEEELDAHRQSLLGRRAMMLDSYEALASYLLMMASTGRPLDYDLVLDRWIRGLDADATLGAARRWLASAGRFVSIAGGMPGSDCPAG